MTGARRSAGLPPFSRAGRTHLQELALDVFEGLRLYPSCDDARKTQQPQDDLHVCTLRNEVLDGRDLPVDIIRGEQV